MAALLGAFAASTACAAGPAYPSKPIRIIATTTPGPRPDIIARLIGQNLMEAWGRGGRTAAPTRVKPYAVTPRGRNDDTR